MITLRLLNDTVLTSLIRGISMGLVAHFVAGFVFLPVFLIGSFVGLVPVVEAQWYGSPFPQSFGDAENP